MQVLINISAEEIETLQKIKEIKDTSDVVFCLHELIDRTTSKNPEVLVRDTDAKIGNITFKKGVKIYKCGHCGMWITKSCRYCHQCGREILWEVENG